MSKKEKWNQHETVLTTKEDIAELKAYTLKRMFLLTVCFVSATLGGLIAIVRFMIVK